MRSFPLLVACTLLALPTDTKAAADLRGVITQFNAERNELVIETVGLRARGQQFTVAIVPQTRIRVGFQPAQVADLTVGRRVRVQYEMRNGRAIATSISSLGLLPLDQPASAPAVPVPAAVGNSVIGELRRVAITGRELVVLDPRTKEETSLVLPDEIQITKQGQPGLFTDLKEGEQALVHWELREGKRIATAVQVGESASAAAATPSAESRIQKIRKLLQTVGRVLDMAERGRPIPE